MNLVSSRKCEEFSGEELSGPFPRGPFPCEPYRGDVFSRKCVFGEIVYDEIFSPRRNLTRGNGPRGNGPRGNGPRGNGHTGKSTQSRIPQLIKLKEIFSCQVSTNNFFFYSTLVKSTMLSTISILKSSMMQLTQSLLCLP
jgi:hypothetical protein